MTNVAHHNHILFQLKRKQIRETEERLNEVRAALSETPDDHLIRNLIVTNERMLVNEVNRLRKEIDLPPIS